MGDASVTPFDEVRLPCGRILSNRFVKAAMYEHLASFGGGPPTGAHIGLYALWGIGGWGMVMTGNVQIDSGHLTLGRDLLLPFVLDESSIRPFLGLAQAIHGAHEKPPLAIMQVSHSGRQCASFIGGRPLFHPPLAPSAVPLGRTSKRSWLEKQLYKLMFITPKAMELSDIDEVVTSFVRCGELAVRAGFDGVELHASHGYLLSSFLSPKSNHRTDAYSCDTPENALRIVHRIAIAIRKASPSDFVLGIKMNSADYVSSGDGDAAHESEERGLAHLRLLTSWGLFDFVEISGGDYEDPNFMASSNPRQAFFARYATHAVSATSEEAERKGLSPPLVLLTGGIRTPASMQMALERGHADLLGLGRPSVLCPDLPHKLAAMKVNEKGIDHEDPSTTPLVHEPDLSVGWILKMARSLLPLPPLVGAGAGMAWYVVQMDRLARGEAVDHTLTAVGGIVNMWLGPKFYSTATVVVLVLSSISLSLIAWRGL